MNPKKFIIKEFEDEYNGYVTHQEVLAIDDDGSEMPVYSVTNLTDCPEDAIIWRDLVSAEEWLEAVEYGMKLAAAGYDSIESETVESEEPW